MKISKIALILIIIVYLWLIHSVFLVDGTLHYQLWEYWLRANFIFLVTFLLHVHSVSEKPFTMNYEISYTLLFLFSSVLALEDNGLDIFGKMESYYFKMNTLINDIIGFGVVPQPLTRETVFVSNVCFGWLPELLILIQPRRSVFPLLALAAFMMTNACIHILLALFTLGYFTGLASSVFLILPFTFLFFRKMIVIEKVDMSLVKAGFAWAMAVHLLIGIGFLLANFFGVVNENVYFLVLVVWACIPFFVFRDNTIFPDLFQKKTGKDQ